MFFAPPRSRERSKIWNMGVVNPVTISKSRSRCKTQVRNLQHPQKTKSRFKRHGCSICLQNQYKVSKYWHLVFQRPVTIFKSRSKCQTHIKNLQGHVRPQIRTSMSLMFFTPSKLGRKAKIWNIGQLKKIDFIQIKIKMPNTHKEPPAFSNAQY